jgi:hypothetical protein
MCTENFDSGLLVGVFGTNREKKKGEGLLTTEL